MKSRKLLVIFLAFIALLSCIGSVFAYMFNRTEVVPNEFVPATVSCQVVETFSNNQKTSIRIENTSNIEAYLRLHLITYWVDSKGNILYEKPLSLNNVSYDETRWIESGDTYYYKYPVKPGVVTEDLLKENYSLTTDSKGNRQVVEVFAEAIQSKPAYAVKSAWHVTLDADGNISAGISTP